MQGLGCQPPCTQRSMYKFTFQSLQVHFFTHRFNQPGLMQYWCIYLLKKPCISRPIQFKFALFKGQLYFKGGYFMVYKYLSIFKSKGQEHFRVRLLNMGTCILLNLFLSQLLALMEANCCAVSAPMKQPKWEETELSLQLTASKEQRPSASQPTRKWILAHKHLSKLGSAPSPSWALRWQEPCWHPEMWPHRRLGCWGPSQVVSDS